MKVFNITHNILQKELDKKGYTKINLLPLNIVDELERYYKSMPNSKNEAFGFHVTLDLNSEDKICEFLNYISDKIKEFTDVYFEIYKYISPRFAKKGTESKMEQSILLDHQLIHLSRNNKTNISRDTLILGVKEKGAQIILCFAEGNLLSEFEMKISDYYKLDIEHIKRNNKLLNKSQNIIPKLDKRTLKELINNIE